jgi:hypothetical protein
MEHALGYAIDHPLAIASRESKTHYPIALLMEGEPYQAPPSRYFCPDVAPNALNQDGVGACVAFAVETIWNAVEHKDWGKWLFDTGKYVRDPSPYEQPTGAFLAYHWLKNGTPDGSFPGDGIPGVDGSYPEAMWKMGKVYGFPDATGKLHKVEAYYTGPLGSMEDFAVLQQVLMTLGPVNIAGVWFQSWMKPPDAPRYIVEPGGMTNGAHSYTIVGWETYEGIIYLTFVNTWGEWGSPQGIFRVKLTDYFKAPMGPQIYYKATDRKDAPLPPLKGDAMRMADTKPRLISVPVGTQLYRPDSVTPSIKLSRAVVDGYSPFAVDSVSYALRITTGGASQIAVVRKNKCTNVKPYCSAPAAVEGDLDADLG